MSRRPPRSLLLALLCVAAGCGDGAWDYDRFPGPLAPGDAAPALACDVPAPPAPTGTCHDCLAALAGAGMRFTSLVITEPVVPTAPDPSALPTFLNNMWTEDVRRHVMNILLRIDAVTAGDDGVTRLDVTAGAGWHDVPIADLPQKPGDPLTRVPTSWYLIPGSLGTFRVELDAGCAFTPLGETALGFHPGPEDSPTMCTPDFGNAIPISRLLPAGRITPDCRGIVAGHLSGCIPRETADRICSWGPSPDLTGWYLQPDETVPPVDPASYCRRWCGTRWVSFGGFVRIIRVPLTCDGDGDGEPDGYTIAGDFTAEIVPLEVGPE